LNSFVSEREDFLINSILPIPWRGNVTGHALAGAARLQFLRFRAPACGCRWARTVRGRAGNRAAHVGQRRQVFADRMYRADEPRFIWTSVSASTGCQQCSTSS